MENKFDNIDDSNINIREELEKYLIHWKWFVVSVIVTLILAFIYLRYTPKTYKIDTSIIVKDEKRGGGIASEMAAFADLGMLSGGKSNVENETQILQSRSLAERTVRRLQLNIAYINEGNIVASEMYNNSPLSFNFVNRVFDFDNIRYSFKVKNITDAKFDLFDQENELIGNYGYEEPIETVVGQVIVTKNPAPKRPTQLTSKNKEEAEKPITELGVEIYPIEAVVDAYIKKIQIAPTDKFSSVIELSLLDATPSKAIDYLNTLVDLYNEAGVADKRFISEKTSEFIDSRLVLVTKELGEVEGEVEGYKNVNRITDIPTELELILKDANVYEKQIIDNETQLKVVSSMIEFLKNSKPNELIPGNIIASDQSSSSIINEYNKIVLERNRISVSSTAKNPAIIKLDDQIASMKASVLVSLTRL